jgi:hypothetical protein
VDRFPKASSGKKVVDRKHTRSERDEGTEDQGDPAAELEQRDHPCRLERKWCSDLIEEPRKPRWPAVQLCQTVGDESDADDGSKDEQRPRRCRFVDGNSSDASPLASRVVVPMNGGDTAP